MTQLQVALYARVSTTDQNCEMQLSELREYTARRGWNVVAEYVDTGHSGSKASRPRLDNLMADARKRKFDAVLVWKLDRWGRSLSHTVQSIETLNETGVRWIDYTNNLDTGADNAMGRFMLHIMAAFAQLERELIRERVTAGMKAAKHRGKHCGRPKRVFDRKKLLELRKTGLSMPAIARQMGVGRGTVERALATASGR